MNKQKLPEGWKEVELGKIFSFQKKSTIKAGEGSINGKYKFFTSSDKQSKFIDKYNQDGEYLIFATGGHAGIHYCNEKFATSTDCFIVKIDDKIITKYIYYYLFGKIQLLEEGFKGAGLKHISKGYIQDIKLAYPENKETQKKIVSILEKAEKSKEWRKEADDLTKDFLESLFLNIFGDPINNPKKWEKVNMAKIGANEKNAIVDGPFGASLKTHEYVEEGIPVIRINNVRPEGFYNNKFKYITEEKYNILIRSKVNKNDILMARVGNTIGKSCIFNQDYKALLSTTGVCKITCDSKKINYIFLKAQLNMKSYINYIISNVQGAGQPYLNLTKIKGFELILPPIELQNKFASIVKEVEAMKEQQKHSKNQIDNLFNALMQKAFKGELKC